MLTAAQLPAERPVIVSRIRVTASLDVSRGKNNEVEVLEWIQMRNAECQETFGKDEYSQVSNP